MSRLWLSTTSLAMSYGPVATMPAIAEFCRFDLRTTDAEGARAFYATVLGHDRAPIWPLHEQALARGARPHWLGRLSVDDVERATTAFVERGALQFGPIQPTADGGRATVVRDPGGAVLALGTPPAANGETDLAAVWHVLNTNDVARAAAHYHELFGWEVSDRVEHSGGIAVRHFSWGPGGVRVGSFADIVARPGVHAHWLFFFGVDALEPARRTTRNAGGLALEPALGPSGRRICVCEDPQGAAFGLWERGPNVRGT